MLLRVSAVFSPYLSLKYITYFFLSVCSLPDLSLFPACCRVSSSCFPPLVLRSSCPLCVPWLLCVSCCVLSCVSCRVCPACPSLVSYQAQDGVAVWADAPRICPRPCLLLPMCCRVFRCSSRGLSCLLPCVVWRQ